MGVYETLKDDTRRFGKNGYLEIARRRLKDETGEYEFILLSRGYFGEDGEKRWTKFVTIPDEPEVREWLSQAILRA